MSHTTHCPVCHAGMTPTRVHLECSQPGCQTTTVTPAVNMITEDGTRPIFTPLEMDIVEKLVELADRNRLMLLHSTTKASVARALNSIERKLSVFREPLTRLPKDTEERDEYQAAREQIVRQLANGSITPEQAEAQLATLEQEDA